MKCLDDWKIATGEDLNQIAWNKCHIHPHDFTCMDVWSCLPLPENFFRAPHLVLNKQKTILELMMPHSRTEPSESKQFAFIFHQGLITALENCFKCHLSDSGNGSRPW